jgi:hypothetical protein
LIAEQRSDERSNISGDQIVARAGTLADFVKDGAG